MPLDVRPLTGPDELPAWLRVVRTAFLEPPTVPADRLAELTASYGESRFTGAFEDGDCVGTLRSFPQRVTAVGGAEVVADAISGVSVAPTHRRRGILSRMIGADLAAAHARGEAVATLIAAEYPIYGRFGFGPATHSLDWRVALAATGIDRQRALPAGGGRLALVDAGTALAQGPALHERLRATRPGAIDRSPAWWRTLTGTGARAPGWKEPVYVLHRDADGTPAGLLCYEVDDTSRTAKVHDLLATSPAARRALWTYLCTIDHVTHVEIYHRPPDDVLPLLLPDPRAARVTRLADFLWVRVLDVAAAFGARTYEAPGSLVFGVADASGPAGGTYRLTADADGTGQVERTEEEPELVLDVGDLARLWLGDGSPLALAEAGLLDERTEGAAARAERVLRTARRPWCPDGF
ncbi:GNAT family N-acetyltransferase [Streptomyces sp. SPB074]|uniref:GNAT family N-acetyltransferase n=1 Tax=Streptomyces sp. (strain SPB074) TaxID=465543 RepID=UPI00017F20B3|nr:GNAT family N-acetyltransferase [Streptomyces sp. SPB074]EDY44883.1 GNAT family acetyltransferase [Streptomyces sp. SPB074]